MCWLRPLANQARLLDAPAEAEHEAGVPSEPCNKDSRREVGIFPACCTHESNERQHGKRQQVIPDQAEHTSPHGDKRDHKLHGHRSIVAWLT